MSHDRGCHRCGADKWEWNFCVDLHCPNKSSVEGIAVMEQPDPADVLNQPAAASKRANDRQVGGGHYKTRFEHWDLVAQNGVGYLEGCASKYLTRWRRRGSVQDLQKAIHYAEKLAEMHAEKTLQRQENHSVPHDVVGDFAIANDLTVAEFMILTKLLNWSNAADLREILRRLRELAKEPQEPAAAPHSKISPLDLRVGHVGEPRGYDPEEDDPPSKAE